MRGRGSWRVGSVVRRGGAEGRAKAPRRKGRRSLRLCVSASLRATGESPRALGGGRGSGSRRAAWARPRLIRRPQGAFASKTTSFGPTPARKRLRADSGDLRARAEAPPGRLGRSPRLCRSASGPTWEIPQVVQKRLRAQAGDRRVTQAARLDRSGARLGDLRRDARGWCYAGGSLGAASGSSHWPSMRESGASSVMMRARRATRSARSASVSGLTPVERSSWPRARPTGRP